MKSFVDVNQWQFTFLNYLGLEKNISFYTMISIKTNSLKVWWNRLKDWRQDEDEQIKPRPNIYLQQSPLQTVIFAAGILPTKVYGIMLAPLCPTGYPVIGGRQGPDVASAKYHLASP